MSPMNPKSIRFNVVYFLIAALSIVTIHDLWMQSQFVEPIPYSEFEQRLREGHVKEVVIGTDTIQGEMKESAPVAKRRFVTTRVEPDLSRELSDRGVTYSARIESRLLPTLLSWIVPVLVLRADAVLPGI